MIGPQRDREAFHALYSATVDQVYGYAARRVGAQEAHDVTAETFARAWRAMPTWQERGRPPEAWLLTIARNIIADRWRREGRRPSAAGPAEEADRAVLGRFDAVVDRAVLVQAMARLSPRHRTVLQLRFLRDRSVGEVAEAMGMGSEAVRALTHRALEALRVELRRSGVDGAMEAAGA